jgi:hypothetical protein
VNTTRPRASSGHIKRLAGKQHQEKDPTGTKLDEAGAKLDRLVFLSRISLG